MQEVSEKVRRLRNEYRLGQLDEASVEKDPIKQFNKWMEEVLHSEVPEANAMALGTVGAEGQPSVRMVLLRGYDQDGIMFYTNYDSRKGQELAGNPKAALCFFWAELERQVRVEGTVVKASDEKSDRYFNSRPRGARIGAWASPQSDVIQGREALESMVNAQADRFSGDKVQRPPHWGGYRLEPTAFEFWQGRESRLHDRIRYTRNAEGIWTIDRLAP